jgi:hypothetical protein
MLDKVMDLKLSGPYNIYVVTIASKIHYEAFAKGFATWVNIVSHPHISNQTKEKLEKEA